MVSGSGVWAKVVVADARHHMLGRSAPISANELLNGRKVVVVGCQEICMSGGLVRQKMKYLRFPRKSMNTKPEVQSSQESNLSKFTSEVQISQEHHFCMLQHEIEKLRGDMERMRIELSCDIRNLEASFSANLEAAKVDVIKCLAETLLYICAVGIGTALAIH